MRDCPRIDLASTRLAFWLIAIVAVQIVVSAIVPQGGQAPAALSGWNGFAGPDNPVVRTLGLDRVRSSPLFIASLVLLALNLGAGNVRRIRRAAGSGPPSVRIRRFGSVVFHLSLLVVILGVALNASFRSDRAFGLTEGQVVSDRSDAYHHSAAGPLAAEPDGRFRLELAEIDPVLPVDDATTEAARISLTEAGGDSAEGWIRVNRPLRWRGLEFHLGAVTGYSPEVVVTGPDGEAVFRSFVRLNVGHEGGERVHRDWVKLPREGLDVKIVVEPSAGNAPGVRVEAVAGEAPPVRGTLAPSETLRVAGYGISVPSVRRWCYVHAVHSPWLWLVFTGFWGVLAGLTVSALPRLAGRREAEV